MNKRNIYIVVGSLVIVVGVLIFKQNSGYTETSTYQNTQRQPSTSPEQQLTPVSSISHGHGLAVDRTDSNKVYIATHHGLLVLKDDKELYRLGKSTDDYMGFSPHPTEPKIFFSSGHPSSGGNIGFQKSEDSGLTWKKVSSGIDGPVDFHALTISPVNPNIIYGWYKGNVQRSMDSGKNWEIVSKNILAVYLAADSKDENIVYAATPNNQGVLVSKDKGATWASLSKDLEGSAVSTIVVNPSTSNQLLAFTEALGLVKSEDAGTSWRTLDARLDGDVLFIAFDPKQPSTVYILTHKNFIYKSTDNGTSWNKIR